jgi:hypothetical protein
MNNIIANAEQAKAVHNYKNTKGGTEHSVVFFGWVGIISSVILLAKFPLRFTVIIIQYTGNAV